MAPAASAPGKISAVPLDLPVSSDFRVSICALMLQTELLCPPPTLYAEILTSNGMILGNGGLREVIVS